jgi:hypothetical protein
LLCAWPSSRRRKPGGDDQSLGVDDRLDFVRAKPQAGADGHDAIAADGDVAVEPRIAGAVDDTAVANEDVDRFVVGARNRLKGGQQKECNHDPRKPIHCRQLQFMKSMEGTLISTNHHSSHRWFLSAEISGD